MNAVVQKQHILQAVNWSRFDLEEWLYQFYAWSDGRTATARSMVKVPVDKKMTQQQREELLSEFLLLDEAKRPKHVNIACKIDDNEARAVQRLILDMQGKSEILDDWLNAIIYRYFLNMKWPEMVTKNRTQHDARMDVKCGLAALHSQYGFIKYDPKNRKEDTA